MRTDSGGYVVQGKGRKKRYHFSGRTTKRGRGVKAYRTTKKKDFFKLEKKIPKKVWPQSSRALVVGPLKQ